MVDFIVCPISILPALTTGFSIIEKPVVNAGIIEIGHTMKSTISADHRSLDGAVAAKLLKDFSDILEDPFQIWLNSLDMEVI